jgi:hypothetical protein
VKSVAGFLPNGRFHDFLWRYHPWQGCFSEFSAPDLELLPNILSKKPADFSTGDYDLRVANH